MMGAAHSRPEVRSSGCGPENSRPGLGFGQESVVLWAATLNQHPTGEPLELPPLAHTKADEDWRQRRRLSGSRADFEGLERLEDPKIAAMARVGVCGGELGPEPNPEVRGAAHRGAAGTLFRTGPSGLACGRQLVRRRLSRGSRVCGSRTGRRERLEALPFSRNLGAGGSDIFAELGTLGRSQGPHERSSVEGSRSSHPPRAGSKRQRSSQSVLDTVQTCKVLRGLDTRLQAAQGPSDTKGAPSDHLLHHGPARMRVDVAGSTSFRALLLLRSTPIGRTCRELFGRRGFRARNGDDVCHTSLKGSKASVAI